MTAQPVVRPDQITRSLSDLVQHVADTSSAREKVLTVLDELVAESDQERRAMLALSLRQALEYHVAFSVDLSVLLANTVDRWGSRLDALYRVPSLLPELPRGSTPRLTPVSPS